MTRTMKDSGIEWIGEIPEDWEVVKNKNLFSLSKEKVGEEFKKYQLLSLTKLGVKEKNNMNDGKLPISFNTYQVVYPNQIILCLFDLDVSAVFSGISPFYGMITSAYDVFTVKKGNSNYYGYMFQTIGFNRSYLPYSKSLRKTISHDNFNNIYSLFPPLSEQEKIASILDEKVARIDSIIADTKQSIEELKKYKQSLITETVTKGLDKNVPMKDSGIEWIGKIPEDWEVKRIGNYFYKVKNPNHNLVETNLLSLSYGNIIQRDINTNDGLLPKNFETYNIVLPDDIVLRMTDLQNDHKSLRTGLVGEKGIITSAYITLRVKNSNQINAAYLQKVLYTFDIKKGFYGMGNGVRQGVNFSDIKKMDIIIPPLSEQNQIVEFLDTKTEQIDQLIQYKEELITQYKEYKKSMIYEYVTGKRK